ncbi:ATP phosphoribosyltransferase regulatory subunit, partial [Helicobacter pylori]
QNLYKIDFSIARGLGYYTGIVYETTLNEMKSLGSVCSGGRYDHLTKNFSKENLQGVGASIGIDRLIVALSEMQ